MADSAYTNEELRPHTDSTTAMMLLAYNYFYVVNMMQKVGSIMVDGLKIAEIIKVKNNDLYDALTK